MLMASSFSSATLLMASSSSSATLTVGMVLFPNMTQLDVTGPYEVFARMPATKVYLVAETSAPIRSEHGLTMVPDVTFDTAPPLDIICVPGGIGVNAAMEDEALLQFLQIQARHARYVTSVCTGALALGAAGLLRGYRATTHRRSLDLLSVFGAYPVDQRIVIDRNRITSGGVTAGIDLGLVVASELFDPSVAQEIQVMIEYNPVSPDSGGSWSAAPADLVQSVVHRGRGGQSARRIIAERAAARLDLGPAAEGVPIDSLEPGATLVVSTRNSHYRFVILDQPHLVLVKGGAMFPEAAVVRLEGATAGGSALKMGWILVGFQIEMWLGSVRIRSSAVRSVSIEHIPAVRACDDRAHA
jgi:cyclohexyl-isocyanide hydratase